MKQWYALRSKPKKEALAAAMLSRTDIETYLPQVTVNPRQGKRTALIPFFPGYLFGRLDPQRDEIRLARYTPGVLQVVGYESQPWPVPDDLVLAIRQRLAGSRDWRSATSFRAGDRVVITSGPFRDIEAVFDRHLSAAGRVRVLIQMLHLLCPADVHLGQLRHAKAAGPALA